MLTPKIIALDLDGTLLSTTGEITPYTREQIRSATDNGIAVVISSGRPYTGIPLKEAKELGIEYAITTNGAAVYRILDNACLYEDGLSPELTIDVLSNLPSSHLHLDVFIEGTAYTQRSTFHIIRHSLILPESLKNYIITNRMQVDTLLDFIREKRPTIQKANMIFEQEADGSFICRDETNAYLLSRPELSVVCGGYFNLEFTKAGVTKAKGLHFLCDYLGIPIEASMACGDSENDLDILKAAGLSVAMANAENCVKEVCSYVTSSCNEDGVGRAIARFTKGQKQEGRK